MIKSFEQTVIDGSNKSPDSGVLEVARQLDTINTEGDPIPENAVVFALGASGLIGLIQGAISRSTIPGEYEFLEETYKDGLYGDAYTIAQSLVATTLPEKQHTETQDIDESGVVLND